MLTIIDEWTRECLAIDVARHLRSDDVLYRLAALFVDRGPPDHIRSDNGSEFTAKAVRDWLARVGVTTLYIAPGVPGRTATTNHSTASSETSCSTVRYSTRSRRLRC